MSRLTYLAAALAVGLSFTQAALAQEALVVDGETIASAELFEAAKAEGRFVHYGAFPADSIRPIHEAFTADTGIAVEYVRLSSAPLYQRILSEFEVDKLEADFIDLTDMLLISDLVSRDILNVPHQGPSFGVLPAELKEAEGRWVTYINPVAIIGVNTARLPEADWPDSWADILDPKYDGLLGIPILDGGSAFSMFGLMREDISETFWADLHARNPRVYEGVSPLTTDLARGDLGIAIGAIAEQTIAQIRAGAPLKLIFPSEGLPAFPITGGVATTANNPNAATLYLDWVSSKRGGDAVASAFAYGAHPDSASPSLEGVDFPARDALWLYDLDDWNTKFAAYREDWRAIFGK